MRAETRCLGMTVTSSPGGEETREYDALMVTVCVCVCVSHLLYLWQQFQQLSQRLRPIRLTVATVNIIHYRLIGPGGGSGFTLMNSST